MTRADLDRREVVTGFAVAVIGALMPATAAPSPPPSLEAWIGETGMARIAASGAALDPAGCLALSPAARADLTAFVADACPEAVIRLKGPHDAAAIRAILLHGPGFPGLAVRVARPATDTRHLLKMPALAA